MSTLNSRDIHLAKYANTWGIGPNSAAVDRKVLSIGKSDSGSGTGQDQPSDDVHSCHTRSLRSFRLHPEGQEDLQPVDSNDHFEVKIASLADQRTGAFDDFNCSYFTNKTNELDVVGRMVHRAKSIGPCSRACRLINNSSYSQDILSQDSYYLVESQGGLSVVSKASSNCCDVTNHVTNVNFGGDEMGDSSTERNSYKFSDNCEFKLLNNLQQGGGDDLQMECCERDTQIDGCEGDTQIEGCEGDTQIEGCERDTEFSVTVIQGSKGNSSADRITTISNMECLSPLKAEIGADAKLAGAFRFENSSPSGGYIEDARLVNDNALILVVNNKVC